MRPAPLAVSAASVILTAGILTFTGTLPIAGGTLLLLAGLISLLIAIQQHINDS